MSVDRRYRDGAPAVCAPSPKHATLMVACGADVAGSGPACDRQKSGGFSELGCQVFVDGQFSGEAVVNGGQRTNSGIDRVRITFGPGDLAAQPADAAPYDLALAHRQQGTLFGSLCAATAGGQAQRLPAEQSDRRIRVADPARHQGASACRPSGSVDRGTGEYWPACRRRSRRHAPLPLGAVLAARSAGRGSGAAGRRCQLERFNTGPYRSQHSLSGSIFRAGIPVTPGS